MTESHIPSEDRAAVQAFQAARSLWQDLPGDGKFVPAINASESAFRATQAVRNGNGNRSTAAELHRNAENLHRELGNVVIADLHKTAATGYES